MYQLQGVTFFCFLLTTQVLATCLESTTIWTTRLSTSLCEDKRLPQCPEDFTETDTFCYIIQKSTFPPTCPFKNVQNFNSYKDLVETENLSPVWMPIQRNTSGFFQWLEPSSSYKTIFEISGDIKNKNCLLFYNNSYIEAVSCEEEHQSLCVYTKITHTSNQLCATQKSCHESDFNQKDECFCLAKTEDESHLKAEFLKIYQNNIYKNLTTEVCAFALEKTPEGVYIWSNSKQEVNYTYWSNEAVFDNSHLYGAVTTSGWILTEIPPPCSIIVKKIDLSPSLDLSYDNISETFALKVKHPQTLKILDTDTFAYCFTDAHPSELIYRYPNLNVTAIENDTILLTFTPLEYGSGHYWCESFKYADSTLITTTPIYLRLTKLPEFVGILITEYITFGKDIINAVVNDLDSIDHINSYYIPRIMKIEDTDQNESITVNVHFTPKFENFTSTEDEEFEFLKTVLEKSFDLVAFRSVDFCASISGNLTWPKTSQGLQTISEEYCFQLNGIRLFRTCGGNFIDGAHWLPIQNDCEIVKPSNISRTLEVLVKSHTLEDMDKVCNISEEYQSFDILDIYLIDQFLEHFEPSQILSRSSCFFEILDNLMLMKASVLEEAQLETGSIDYLLDFLDTVLTHNSDDFNLTKTNFFVVSSSVKNLRGLVVQKSGDSFIFTSLNGDLTIDNFTTIDDLESAIWLTPELYSQLSDNDRVTFMFYYSNAFFSESVPRNLSHIFNFQTSQSTLNGPVKILHTLSIDNDTDKSCSYWKSNSWQKNSESQEMSSFQLCDFWRSGNLALVAYPSNITTKLIDILENSYTVAEMINKLFIVSQKYHQFGTIDVLLIGKIFEKVSLLELTIYNILSTSLLKDLDLTNLTEIVSNLLKIDRHILSESQKENGATDLILYNIDKILEVFKYQSSSFSHMTDNFVIFFTDITKVVFTGLVLYNDNEFTRIETLHDQVNIFEDIAQSENFDSAVVLSNQVIKQMYKTSKVIITIFFNDAFFTDSSEYYTSDKIFGVLLPDIGVYSGPVSVFHRANSNQKYMCAHWSYSPPQNSLGFWQQDTGGRSTLSVIECDYWHTTHFALLREHIEEKKRYLTPSILAVTAVISGILSLLGFYGIILTAILFKKWRRNTGNQILLNYVFAIMMELTLYEVAYTQQVKSHILCVIFGAIYHYSIIAQFCWMFVIALLQFKRFVVVFGTTPRYLLFKACLVGWGLPLIPVLCLLIFDYNGYVNKRSGFCYPSGLALVLAIWLPIAIIILSNLIIFVYIIYAVCCRKSDGVGGTEILHQWRLAILLFFMLGLCWMFSLLANLGLGGVFLFLFEVTTNLQGAVIFLYFIVGNKKTRQLYVTALKKRFKRIR